MMKKHCWSLLAYSAVLFEGVLGGALLSGQLGEQRRGEKEMNGTHFTVDHVHRTTQKPFEDVTTAFERQLGHFDPDVLKSLAASGGAEGVRAKIEAMAGPGDFMLFGTTDHGALLRLAGQKRKAVQYVVGNPLFALQMTQHDIRASLYAPLRVLIYENEEGKTCVEYDKPSSLFGQFGDEKTDRNRRILDHLLHQTFQGEDGHAEPESDLILDPDQFRYAPPGEITGSLLKSQYLHIQST